MKEAPVALEASPAPPPTRLALLVRAWLVAVLAIAALWLPVDRLSWSLEAARDGVFANAVVVAEGEAVKHAVDGGGGDGDVTARRRTVTCRYGEPPRTLSFIDDGAYAPGDSVPVAFLRTRPERAVRAEPGTGALGLYFATQSWIVDAALWPIGLVLALATLANLFEALRPRGSGAPPRAP